MTAPASSRETQNLLVQARSLENHGELARADECFQLAVRSSRGNGKSAAYLEYARFLENTGRLKPAAKFLELLLRLAGQEHQLGATLSLGRVYGKLGSVAKANRALKSAIALGKDNPEAYLEMARLAEKAGWYRKMRWAAKTALSIDPGSKSAQAICSDLARFNDTLSSPDKISVWRERVLGRKKRRFMAFGTGVHKSGTTSMSTLFDAYSCCRDFMMQEVEDAWRRLERGELSPAKFKDILLRRDKKGQLEMDFSSSHAYWANHLASTFSNAKFIYLIRDCYSWCDSALNHMLYAPQIPLYRSLLPEISEHAIRRDLYRIADGLIGFWSRLNQRLIDALPNDRTFVIRTHELSPNLNALVAFLGVSLDTLNFDRAHSNKTEKRYGFLAQGDKRKLDRIFARHSAKIMREYFPDYALVDFLDGRKPPPKTDIERERI